MQQLSLGGRVRIDIPNEDDPDFQWHGEHGVVTAALDDDAGSKTGDTRDSQLYRVELGTVKRWISDGATFGYRNRIRNSLVVSTSRHV